MNTPQGWTFVSDAIEGAMTAAAEFVKDEQTDGDPTWHVQPVKAVKNPVDTVIVVLNSERESTLFTLREATNRNGTASGRWVVVEKGSRSRGASAVHLPGGLKIELF